MSHDSLIPKLVILLAAATFLWSCESEYTMTATGSERDRQDSLQSGGITRTYSVHLPVAHETANSPVVIMFHQDGASGLNLKYLTEFDLEADNYGFLAVYPNASSDWGYGCGCTNADSSGVDDVQFVTDLLNELDADYGINRDSVFVIGYSEGVFMAQKLVCEMTDTFAGMATVSATMLASLAETCTPSKAIPVLMINGTGDDEYPFAGALDRGPSSVVAADTALHFWANSNGCGERQTSLFIGTDTYYQFDVYRESFDACPAGGEAVMLRMDEADHGWPSVDFSAAYEIGRFFLGACCGAAAPEHLPR